MERKASLPLYAAAFVISLVIFFVGIYIGQLIDQSNLQSVSAEVERVSQKASSLQLLMLMEGNSSFCPVYLSELSSVSDEVEKVGYKLSYLEDEKHAYDPELKKQYFVLEAESYLLSKKARQLCGDRSVLLMYFYSNGGCASCRQQGNDILAARDAAETGNVSVKLFSFDGDLGSPVADAFANQYNITTYPSIVVNDRVYPGYHDPGTLATIIKGAS